MRLFGIQEGGRFQEYVSTPFHAEHEERVLEDWLETNPRTVLEDGGILILGRQVMTHLGGFVDLLGLDREGSVVVVELKRDRTPRDTLAQVLEYAAFAQNLKASDLEAVLRSYQGDDSVNLMEYHRAYFGLEPEEAVSFNQDQRLVIMGQNITRQVVETARYLRSRGVRVTCVAFSFFQTEEGKRLMSQEWVVGLEADTPRPLVSTTLPLVTEESFLAAADTFGRPVFQRLLRVARDLSLPIHWGSKGLSLNVDLEGAHVVVCFLYPPDSVHRQIMRTALLYKGGVAPKTAAPEQEILALRQRAEETGLFVSAGRELKCPISRPFTSDEMDLLVFWCEQAVAVVRKYGLRE